MSVAVKYLSTRTSSGTALMLVNPRLKITNTLLAPQRNAAVAQSNAVSPAPKTITFPYNSGKLVHLQSPQRPALLPEDTFGRKVFEV